MRLGNRGYSTHLREKAMAALGKGMKPRQVAEVFGVARGTIYNWLSLKNSTGGLEPRQISQYGPQPKVAHEIIKAKFETNPGLTQKKAAKELKIANSTLSKILNKLGLKRKKKNIFI